MIKQILAKGFRSRCARGLGMLVAALGLCSVVLIGSAAPAMAYQSATATIPVTVETTGDKASTTPEFTFSIEGLDEASQKALASTSVTVDADGQASFEVKGTEPSEYWYCVTQTTSSADGWTLDTQKYYVQVLFENVDGSKTPDVMYVEVLRHVGSKTGVKADTCHFSNSYKATVQPASSTTPASTKTDQTSSASSPKMGDPVTYAWIAVAAVAATFIIVGLFLRQNGDNAKSF